MTKPQNEFEERAIKEQNELIYKYNREQDPLNLSFIERKMQERLNKQLREAIREAREKRDEYWMNLLGEDWKARNSFEIPDPITAIQFRMEQYGHNQSQMAKKIGYSKSKVSEVLNGKRPFSLGMMRAFVKYGVPAEVFIKQLNKS